MAAGRMSRGVALALCGMAVVVVAATPASVPERVQGEVRGVVVRPPGRDPRSGAGVGNSPVPRIAAAPSVPVNGDPVRARDLRGQVVASTVTAPPDGSFSFGLSPGTYRITEDIVGIGRQVEVRAGATVSVTLTIPSAH
ncbi:hypothetical protein SAMN02787118_12594 [Streptomyces mirabilis]|jgi:hypothetical protein|uniref:Carboxypeptidase regulatory-like domain-containing protein n=2 Tax=Streptomyces mirabilis TaxID=68239 RepID=A0A1I2TTU9_9ACTN|nr:hypothetical protein SAMN02787118_12594 [Streptomyces mirabilis]